MTAISAQREPFLSLLILAATLLARSGALCASGKMGPLKVFILAGQSNMDGNANVSTIDFLGEDKEHGTLLKKFKPDGKTLVTRVMSGSLTAAFTESSALATAPGKATARSEIASARNAPSAISWARRWRSRCC